MNESTIKIIFLILILVATALEIVGDILFKKWSLNGKSFLFVVGFLIYAIGVVFWGLSLKYGYLSEAISILTVLNLVIISLVGVLYFHEDLSLINKIGIALGVVSVILIEI